MTQIADIRGKTTDELNEMAVTLRKELFNLRFQIASGETVSTSRFKAVRQDIARIKTVVNDPQQKTAGAAKPAKAAKAKAEAPAKATKEVKAKKASAKKKASEE
jgi:large subunit ribosomal protein L29